jgi:hypothetical protein
MAVFMVDRDLPGITLDALGQAHTKAIATRLNDGRWRLRHPRPGLLTGPRSAHRARRPASGQPSARALSRFFGVSAGLILGQALATLPVSSIRNALRWTPMYVLP